MEKVMNDFSVGLFLWQLVMVALLIVIVFFLFKLFKKIMK